MYTVNKMSKGKYTCTMCNKHCSTKSLLDQHQTFCIFIHTSSKEQSQSNIQIPSQEIMFQYIIHLTKKYEQLEQKISKIEKSTTNIRKKHINDYIASLKEPTLSYSQWLNKIEITQGHLDKLFSGDLKMCIKNVLEDVLHDGVPLLAFQQKQNIIYIFDTKWRIITNEEFSKLISIISHRILKKYMSWANDHKEQLESNSKMQELSMIYMSKANGLNCNIDTCSSDIKKWLFTKISISMKNIEM